MSILLKSQHWFMNYGDRVSSKMLSSLLYTWTSKEIELQHTEEPIIKDYELVIFGPGGILLHIDNEQYLPNIDNINCPIVIFSGGFNFRHDDMLDRELFYQIEKNWLCKVDLVGLRCELGVNIVKKFFPDKEVYHCPDPLMFIGDKSPSQDKVVAISLYRDEFKYVIDLVKSMKYEVKYIEHDDLTFNLNDYRDCEFVITNRFHGAILAAAFNKPFIMLSSNCKHDYIAKDLECSLVRDMDNKLTSDDIYKWVTYDKEYHKVRLEVLVKEYYKDFNNFMSRVCKLL